MPAGEQMLKFVNVYVSECGKRTSRQSGNRHCGCTKFNTSRGETLKVFSC